jgi:hypothetical protein
MIFIKTKEGSRGFKTCAAFFFVETQYFASPFVQKAGISVLFAFSFIAETPPLHFILRHSLCRNVAGF